MHREYELYEQLPDGSPMWRGHATGLQNVRLKILELAGTTKNMCFAMQLGTKEVVARLNEHSVREGTRKQVVCQIAYDDKLVPARTALLRSHGYEAISIIGNESAKLILTVPQHVDLFMVGYATPDKERKDMVAWLRKHFPGARVLALNLSREAALPEADYNVKLNGPEVWLSMVSTALSTS